MVRGFFRVIVLILRLVGVNLQALSAVNHASHGDHILAIMDGSQRLALGGKLALGDDLALDTPIPFFYLLIFILAAAGFFIYRERKIRQSRRELNQMIQARSR